MQKIHARLILLILVISGLVIRLVMQIEYPWYFSESAKLFDLAFTSVLLVMTMSGVYMLWRKLHLYLNLFLFLFFVMVQTVNWTFNTKKELAHIYIDVADAHMMLISVDSGAFSSNSFANLIIMRNRFNLFYSGELVQSFDDVKSGDFIFGSENSALILKLKTFTGESKDIALDTNTVLH